MDYKKEHRRRRLLELLELYYHGVRGHQSRAAERIEVDRNYLTRVLSSPEKSGHKNIGEDLQDRIEAAYNLPPGWLDLPLGTPIMEANNTSQHKIQAPTPTYQKPNSKLETAITLLRNMSVADQEDVIWYIQCVSQKTATRTDSAGLPVPAPASKAA